MTNQEFKDLLFSGKLPTPPGIGMRILELTRDDDYSIEKMGEILRADSALTGRILKLANSAVVSGSQPATTVEESVMRLGSKSVRDLALAFSLVSGRRESACRSFDYGRYWSKSLARAVSAQVLACEVGYDDPQGAYVLGLLAEVGRLALAHVYPEAYAQFIDEGLLHDPETLMQREAGAFGIDHAELAACMLGEWGLPDAFVEAARRFQGAPDWAATPRDAWSLTRILYHAETFGSLMAVGATTPAASLRRYGARLEALQAELAKQRPALASLFDRAVREWIAWGVEMHIAVEKSVRFAKLDEAMRAAEREQQAAEPRPSVRPAASASGDDERVRVLAVDDEPMQRRLLSKHLLQAGYEVLVAKDGKEALGLALERVPDIVVADYLMPELDGLDLCRALRRTDAGSKMYFILVSGRDDPEALIDAFEAGADDFMTKPYVPRLMHARIKGGVRVVRLQRRVDADRRVVERQMAELSVLTRKLRTAAMTDSLTGLPNRRYAMKRMEGEWAFSSRSGRPLCLIMLDIDHFKSVNDEHGHDVGDFVLASTARVLKQAVRESDEVCRLGGEEFVVICRNMGEEEGCQLAERLRRAVESNVVEGRGFDRKVSVSLGIASSEDSPAGVDALLRAADLAVYRAKDQGRNRCARASSLPALGAAAPRLESA